MARTAVHIGVLCGFAVAQPLFETLSQNAAIFAFRQSSPLDLLLLALGLSAGLPAALILLVWFAELVKPAAGRWFYLGLVVLLTAVTVLATVSGVQTLSARLLIASAGFTGLLVAVAYQRLAVIRTFFTMLAPSIVIFPVLFLVREPIRGLVFPRQDTPATSASIARPVPIVMVVFDELSLVSLLDEKREIDPVRFPHFAALAAEGTWFRQATTVAENTDHAVPAIVSGRYPKVGVLPQATNYPESLFTLLGSHYRFNVAEADFPLCPERLCNDAGGSSPPEAGPLLLDATVVYLHIVVPVSLRGLLPSIEGRWGNFLEDRSPRAGTAPSDETSGRMPAREHFREFVARIEASPGPTLHYLKTSLPHIPWHYLPSCRQYGPVDRRFQPGGVVDETWTTEVARVRQGLQQYLLQVGCVDTLLGELLARLKTVDVYDQSLIIVTADHGVSLRPGDSRRPLTKTNYPDIAAVPLIVKAPYQRGGIVSDRNVESIDILPTIASILGVGIPWKVDGQPALDDAGPARPTKSMYGAGGEFLGLRGRQTDGMEDAVNRFLSVAGPNRTWAELFRLGPRHELVDRAVSSLSVVGGRLPVELDRPLLYDAVHPEGMFVPAMVEGTVGSSPDGGAPLHLAVAVNGTIRATTTTFNEGQRRRFSALVPETAFQQGRNNVVVFVVTDTRDDVRVVSTVQQSSPAFGLTRNSDDPASVVLTASGVPLVMDQTVGAGFVERIDWDIGAFNSLVVSGWASDRMASKTADAVVVLEGDRFVYADRPAVERVDVVADSGLDSLLMSGFEFRVPLADARAVDLERIRVFAISRGVAFELPRITQRSREIPPETVPVPLSLDASAYEGFLDAATCTSIDGWAWNRGDQGARLVIEIIDGSRVLARVAAERERRDLAAAGIGDGRYAFSFGVPTALRDGMPHAIGARIAGTSVELRGTPRTLACSRP